MIGTILGWVRISVLINNLFVGLLLGGGNFDGGWCKVYLFL